ncbi:phospholipase D-like domain-containing protein [Mesorhizobium sp. ASY16-5R]|uniref:phospholipase D-like domain-containing protein n=1 Tax=Mesorhizobium sp. ASY16-5R TaxID=3445772 RepID=UPI003FA09A3B
MNTITLRASTNADDVHLAWDPGEKIPGCLGFAIECKRGNAEPKYLSNRVGFKNDPTMDENGEKATKRSSQDWPFQRYDWTDHAADLGDEVAYRVVARIETAASKLSDGPASNWTPMLKLSPDCGDGLSAFFNRGFVLSQFMARYMKKHGITMQTLKEKAVEIATAVDKDARIFLGGDLRKVMLALLEEVRATPALRLHAALYELEDDELVEALARLGDRASIVLANGSVNVQGDDQNKTARAHLRAANVDVHDRMISPKALGHNKFVVIGSTVGAAFKPLKAWTGSTNWTPTGLCTQLNNGLLIENDDVAAVYETQFQRLKDAASTFPKALVDANSQPTRNIPVGAARADVWFSRLRKQVDIGELVELVKGARQGVFFVMFMPGQEPLKTLLAMQEQKDLYVRGVATRFSGEGKEKIKLLKSDPESYALQTIEATGVGDSVGEWAVEGTAQQFFNSVGFAITHSKVLVIDPFGDDPVVVTGSHNFSTTASEKNDENFIVFRGNKRLAEQYAINCMQTYSHYRWRAYLAESKAEHRDPFEFLSTRDTWQSRRTSRETAAMLKFWL